jgi:branched-chain amino acid transport system substrate-binding protein
VEGTADVPGGAVPGPRATPAPAAPDRRAVLRLAGLSALGLALPAGCSTGPRARTTGRPLTIGYVSPQTGALAAFAEADGVVLDGVRAALAGGLERAGGTRQVDILVKDSQSDPRRAATVTGDLLASTRVDVMLVASTADTVNPVAEVCERIGVPCISTLALWQTWLAGRTSRGGQPFRWTWHFFGGLDDVIAVFLDLWRQLPTNRVAGALWSRDPDGRVWSQRDSGFPKPLAVSGYELVDPGPYQHSASDFRSHIRRFQRQRAQILFGVCPPADFATFWRQAASLQYRPRVVTAGTALLFPAFIDAMVPSAQGVATEVWWSPAHPFRSSLTGQTAAELAADYTTRTAKQWTQPLGLCHALFEVAVHVLRRVPDPDDSRQILEEIRRTDLRTVAGRITWRPESGLNPFPNVCKVPLTGGQWRRGGRFPLELGIVSNKLAPAVPRAGSLLPLGG